jgi:HEAT repeat protein
VANELDQLARDLEVSADWRIRRGAARALGRSGDVKWADALMRALDDRDPDVVAGAIDGLLRVGDKRATSRLVRPKVIGNPEPVVRWLALQALGALGGEETVEPVVRLLDDREWVIRNEARTILGRRISALASAPRVETLPLLVRMLSIRDPEVREAVVVALGSLGMGATGALVDALQIPSVHVREGAARALGRIADPASLAALAAASRDEEPSVRRAAGRALGAFGGRRTAVQALIRLLGDSGHEVPGEAEDALVRISTPAVGYLIESLRHVHSVRSRRNIVRVLGRLRDGRAITTLLEQLGSGQFLIRSAAIDAVVAFGDAVVGPLMEMLERTRVPVAPLLKDATSARSKRVRLHAIRALGELRSHGVVDALKALAEDPDDDIARAAERSLALVGCAAWGRACAAITLGRLKASEAVKPLIRALRDPSHDVRSAAVRGLGEMGDWRLARAVASVLVRDPDPEVRADAALVLQRIGRGKEVSVKAAVRAMQDSSRAVRSRAATALGRFQDGRAVPALAGGLGDRYWSVRRDCENALANLGTAAVGPLLEYLRSATDQVGARVLTTLARIGPEDLPSMLRHELPRIQAPALKKRAEELAAGLSLSGQKGSSTPPVSR